MQSPIAVGFGFTLTAIKTAEVCVLTEIDAEDSFRVKRYACVGRPGTGMTVYLRDSGDFSDVIDGINLYE